MPEKNVENNDYSKIIEIWVDVDTDVHYLWHSIHESCAGITPLLDENGKPVVNKNINFLKACEDKSWIYIG